jgi:dTDP-4-dehydrorhamnose 3,5-epimerase
MKFLSTKLRGVTLIEPDVHRDQRGFFLEAFHAEKYRAGGIAAAFVQDNHSSSVKNTLRGLHLQTRKPQGKLVRVLKGEIWDVVADIRPDSPTFKVWEGFSLTSDNFRQIYVPPGYVHGFVVISETAEVEYKCTDFYDPGGELGVRWNDPDLAIAWPVQQPVLSAKDAALPTLQEAVARLFR